MITALISMTSTNIAVCQDTNPFFEDYDAPFGIPPFDQITDEHYGPAFEKGMAEHLAEIEAIANNPEPATIENTLVALDQSGKLLDRVSSVFFNLSSSDTNETIEDLELEYSPRLSAHNDAIVLNEKLFERVNAVWEMRTRIRVERETLKLMEETFKKFKRGGALLSAEDKKRVTEINAELASLDVKFGQNLLAETKDFKLVIDNVEDLAGLPDSSIAAAAEAAESAEMQGKWVFTTDRSSMYPFLTYSPNREFREQIYNAYIARADNDNEHDNKLIVARTAALRAERAQLLGYPTHAHYVLEETMAKTPEKVYELLNKVWEPAVARAKTEVVEMQKIVDDEGGDFKIAGYDWWYYAEKVREEKYAFEEEALKPYFPLDACREGVFDVATKLFGVTFHEINDVPLYHEDAQAFEVKDADGTHLGVFICDYYTRESKRGGAWMSNFREQSNTGESIRPIVVNVCNFPPPVDGEPSLLTFDQVTTLFHEFGHALHGLLSQVKYKSLAGTNVPRDYVEFPAQLLEHWAGEPEVLKNFAKHFETGEVIPEELIKKVLKAAKFNQGFKNTEYLAAAFLDMDWHTQTNPQERDTNAFEKESLERIGLIPEIESRYRSTQFQHIFSGGYSSGYYSYLWSAVLDSDGFDAFKQSGDLFDPELAAKYRKNILETGGTDEGMNLYKAFRGAEPSIDALLKDRGLDGSNE